MVTDIRDRITDILRKHRLIDGRCQECGVLMRYESDHQAAALVADLFVNTETDIFGRTRHCTQWETPITDDDVCTVCGCPLARCESYRPDRKCCPDCKHSPLNNPDLL